jgi:hypothetical protein
MIDDAYTRALLHLIGANGSTTVTDENGRIWTVRGNAQLDTTQLFFGTSTLLLDGTGDSVDTPDSSDFYVNAADGAIDFRVRFTVLPSATGDSMGLCGQYADNSHCARIYIWKNAAANNYTFSWNINGAEFTKTGTLLINTWYHIALVKYGTTYRFYLDGTSLGDMVSATAWPDVGAVLDIGAKHNTTYDLNGRIKEFRFSNGTSRWTANFLPPTMPYGVRSGNGLAISPGGMVF